MGLSGSQLAYKQARSGIERADASRTGFFTPNVVLQINGVDRSDALLWNSLHITQAINDEPDTAYFTITPQDDAVYPYSAAILADGPESYWRLNESSGNPADSADAITLTANGTPSYSQTGPLSDGSTAILLNGTDAYFTAGDVYDFAGTLPFSVEFFIKLAANSATEFVRIVSKEETDGGGRQGWSIGVDPANQAVPRAIFFDRWLNGVAVSIRTAHQLVIDVWTHVVCTYSGTQLRIYINGVEDANSPVASTASLVNHTTALHIGRRSSTATAFLNATLSDVAPYDGEVLTAPQAAAHYALRTATVLTRPVAGQQVVIGLGDAQHREFAGQILRTTHRRQHPRMNLPPFVDVDCIDWIRLFDRRSIATEYSGQSATAIARDIIATWTSGFTSQSVADGLPTIDYFPLTNETPSRALRRLTTLLGGFSGFRVDEHRDVHLWGAAGEIGARAPTAPVTLTNTLSSLKTFQHTWDISQVRTRAIVEGMRTLVPISVPVGATDVPVDDEAPFRGFSGSALRARLGTQRVEFAIIAGTWGATDPAGRNRPGTHVRTAAAVGATTLDVDDSDFDLTGSDWLRVDEQVIKFGGKGGPPDFFNLIPASGYGSIQAPIKVGAPVLSNPALEPITFDETHPVLAPVHAGTEAVNYVQINNVSAQAALAQIEGGDGIHEHLVSDGRLTRPAARARADQEVAMVPSAVLSATWETEDMNARPGTRQVIALTTPDALSATLTIMRATLTFRAPNRRPRRRCEATTVRPARVLDVLELERQ